MYELLAHMDYMLGAALARTRRHAADAPIVASTPMRARRGTGGNWGHHAIPYRAPRRWRGGAFGCNRERSSEHARPTLPFGEPTSSAP